jgi:hypothetical protein
MHRQWRRRTRGSKNQIGKPFPVQTESRQGRVRSLPTVKPPERKIIIVEDDSEEIPEVESSVEVEEPQPPIATNDSQNTGGQTPKEKRNVFEKFLDKIKEKKS